MELPLPGCKFFSPPALWDEEPLNHITHELGAKAQVIPGFRTQLCYLLPE